MSERWDLVVLGTGNAGQAAAGAARRAGKRVAIVDGRDPGGTCALRGCVPKKVLVAAAEALDLIRRAKAHHIDVGPAKLDWAGLIARETAIVGDTSEQVRRSLASQGIELVTGWARFVDEQTVEVDGRRLSAEAFVVATGSTPRPLSFPGVELLRTSDDVLSDPVLPESVVFVGTGVIAFEFAHVFVRAGSTVTMLGRRPLAGYDADAVQRLVAATRRAGVDVQTGADVRSVSRDGLGYVVRWSDADGDHETRAAAVFHAAGRVPDLARLDLPAAGVEADGGKVDASLRSLGNPRISFAGDALPRTPQLSPVATWEGAHAARAWLGEERGALDYGPVPHVVFSIPALAAVGLTAEEARRAGLDVEVKDNDMAGWRSSRTYAEEDAWARVVLERGTGRLVGATLLGHGGPEVIHLFAFALARGLRAADLANAVYAYPTHHADVRYLL